MISQVKKLYSTLIYECLMLSSIHSRWFNYLVAC
nr:MAG TPA: hypothetical protein [Caudoviricetes sp.]